MSSLLFHMEGLEMNLPRLNDVQWSSYINSVVWLIIHTLLVSLLMLLMMNKHRPYNCIPLLYIIQCFPTLVHICNSIQKGDEP